MMRRLVRPAALLLATLGIAGSVGSPAASAKPAQLGPPPVSADCRFRPDLSEGTNCYYGGIGGMQFSNSPHILRVGEKMSINVANTVWDSFQASNGVYVTRTVRNFLLTSFFNPVFGSPCPRFEYMIFSGSCELEAKSTTNGWRTHGYNLTIGNGSSYTAGDYFAILPDDVYEIGGKLTKLNPDKPKGSQETPAAGVKVFVEQTDGPDKYETAANADGRYSVQVTKGAYRVRVGDDRLCYDGSAANCERHPSTTVPGDRTLNWTMPAPIKATGVVKTDDGTFVEGAKVRATQINDDGSKRVREAWSDKSGAFTIDELDANSEITFDSPVPYICPVTPGINTKIGNDSKCEVPKRLVTSKVDVVQDFEKPGCIAKIDFGTSMAARSRCFKLTAPEQWETDEPFRLNGIDFTPDHKVKFDKEARTVDFGEGHMGVSVEWEGKSHELPDLQIGGLVSFETALTKFSMNAGIPIPPGAGFAGFPMSEQASVEMGSGTSNLSLKLTVPVDVGAQYDWVRNNFGKTKTMSISAKFTTTNDFGVGTIGGSLENPGNVAGVVAGFKNPIAWLKEIKVSYDKVNDLWSFGGKLEPSFFKNTLAPGQTVPDADARGGTIEGTITSKGIPGFGGTFQSLTGALTGRNLPVGGGFYLQRLRLGVPLSLWDSNSAGSISVGAGLSLGPANQDAETFSLPLIGGFAVTKPAEKLSLDGDLTVSWSNLDDTPASLTNDLKFNGEVAMKLWDQEVGRAAVSVYPAQRLVSADIKNIGVTDPTGGSIFVVRGEAGLSIDLRKEGSFYMGGRGNITFGGKGFVGDWLIVGAEPTIFATCAEVFGVRIGGAINFSNFWDGHGGLESEHDDTCDLAPYRLLKPAPPTATKPVTPPPFASGADRARRLAARAAKPGKTQTFKATGDEGVVPMQLTASGGSTALPDVKLTGPGISQTLSGTKSITTNKLVTMIFPAERKLQVVFKSLKKGTYKLQVMGAGKDGPVLEAPKFSRVLPEPEIETTLDRSTCSPTVTWSASNVAGQSLRFLERSAAGDAIVGTSKDQKGKLTIAAQPGAGRSELIVQIMNGVTVRKEQTIGSYTSSVSDNVPGPSGVAVKAAKGGAKGKAAVKQSTVSWNPVCGAEAYSVVTSSGKTDGAPVIVTGTTATIPRPKGKATVTVTSLGRDRVVAGSTLIPVN